MKYSIFLLLSVCLFSCCKKNEQALKGPDRIDGIRWVLEAIPNFETKITLSENEFFVEFGVAEKNTLIGYGGCNKFSGSYNTRGLDFSAGPLMSTKRYCELMPIETEFMRRLETTDRYELNDNRLYLYEGKDVLLQFKL